MERRKKRYSSRANHVALNQQPGVPDITGNPAFLLGEMINGRASNPGRESFLSRRRYGKRILFSRAKPRLAIAVPQPTVTSLAHLELG